MTEDDFPRELAAGNELSGPELTVEPYVPEHAGVSELTPEPAPVAFLRTYGKAIAGGLVAGCAYLAGVVDDGITAQEWLGLVPFIAAGYGITAYAPSRRTG